LGRAGEALLDGGPPGGGIPVLCARTPQDHAPLRVLAQLRRERGQQQAGGEVAGGAQDEQGGCRHGADTSRLRADCKALAGGRGTWQTPRMALRIEDYALLSNCRTAALVSREGSIDWLCLPRLDSPSTFAALLGDEDHGRWELRPLEADAVATRRYDRDTFVLVTRWESADAVAEVHDFMPIDPDPHVDIHRIDIIRRVVGVRGTMHFAQRLSVRFDYSRAMPWVRQTGSPDAPELIAMAGPDALVVRGAALRAADHQHEGDLTVAEGETRDLH